MPRVPPVYHARRHAEIVRAARTRFARDGFHSTSMDDVIAEARLSSSTVYRQFGGKAELVRAVVDDVLDELSALLGEALAAVGDAPSSEALARILGEAPSRAGARASREGQAIALYAWAEAQRDPALRRHLRTRWRRLLAAHRALLDRWLGSRRDSVDLDSVVQVFAALIPGGYVLRLILGKSEIAAGAATLFEALKSSSRRRG